MSLDLHGLGARFKRNLCPAALYEEAVRHGEGMIAEAGPLSYRTGSHTGRSPKDKFVVREPSSADAIDWGAVNRPMTTFETLEQDFAASLRDRDLFVQDCYAGADTRYRLAIRVVTEYDAQAARPAGMFSANFRTFESTVTAAVRAAGPVSPS